MRFSHLITKWFAWNIIILNKILKIRDVVAAGKNMSRKRPHVCSKLACGCFTVASKISFLMPLSIVFLWSFLFGLRPFLGYFSYIAPVVKQRWAKPSDLPQSERDYLIWVGGDEVVEPRIYKLMHRRLLPDVCISECVSIADRAMSFACQDLSRT